MRCQVCSTGGQVDAGTCTYCGATVCSVEGRGARLPDEFVRGRAREGRAREVHDAERRRRRARAHAVVGAAVFLALGVALTVANMLGGMVSALVWRSPSLLSNPLLDLGLVGVMSLLAGAPAGYVVSRRNVRPLGGALLGALFFSVGLFLMNIRLVVSTGSVLVPLAMCFALGSVPGMVVGSLIGLHVRSEGE